MQVEQPKTRIPLCWNCARRFRGRTFTTVTVHGEPREVHISCAYELQESGLVSEVRL